MQAFQFQRLRLGVGLLSSGLWLIIATGTSLAGPPSDGTRTNLVIGLLMPPEQAEGASIRDGVTLAVEEANTKGPASVRVVVRGRIGQWGADAVEAARMVTDDGATGLIAPPNGAATHLVLQIAGRTAVPVASLCADSSVTRTGVPWMLRVVPSTIQEGQALFRCLQDEPPGSGKRLVALVPDDRAGREIDGDLRKAAQGTSFILEKTFKLPPSGENTASIAHRILQTKPDVILIWLDPAPAGVVAEALRAAGFKGTLAGPGRLRSTQFMTSAGQGLEGFAITELVLEANEARLRAFQTAFRKRFGYEPEPASVFSYDAARLLIHLLQTSGVQASRAFPIGFSWQGASGTLRFDAEGNRAAELRLLVAHQGRWGKGLAEGNKQR